MAKTDTPAPETAAPAAPAAPAVFEIADDSVLTRGRIATPGIYDAQVRDAVEGKSYGINVASKEESVKVLNELRKAAKHTGRKLRTWNKSDETPGYVAFKVVPAKPVVDTSAAGNPFPAVAPATGPAFVEASAAPVV
jgi:hypothetical protein